MATSAPDMKELAGAILQVLEEKLPQLEADEAALREEVRLASNEQSNAMRKLELAVSKLAAAESEQLKAQMGIANSPDTVQFDIATITSASRILVSRCTGADATQRADVVAAILDTYASKVAEAAAVSTRAKAHHDAAKQNHSIQQRAHRAAKAARDLTRANIAKLNPLPEDVNELSFDLGLVAEAMARVARRDNSQSSLSSFSSHFANASLRRRENDDSSQVGTGPKTKRQRVVQHEPVADEDSP
ncbi:hypothetical protein BKA62DRAFT_380753 [Auriculariales sp. MPI-PUGE-AT-0066]|nr:hypothetical protein BKA62DRAFT_380753 [Auriculariales sp. MPI-PUGE-AT-0066]